MFRLEKNVIEPEALVELLFKLFYKISSEKKFMNSRRAFMSFLIGTFNKSFSTNLDPGKMCVKLGIVNKLSEFESFLSSQLKGTMQNSTTSIDMETASGAVEDDDIGGIIL